MVAGEAETFGEILHALHGCWLQCSRCARRAATGFAASVRWAQLAAGDKVKFLSNNKNYERFVLHGFSVDGYLWGECLIQLQEDQMVREAIAKQVKA